MNAEQKAVVLDYATELQSNDEPWRKFEYCCDNGLYEWRPAEKNMPFNMHLDYMIFRRKPKTITVTMPVPDDMSFGSTNRHIVYITYNKEADRDIARVAIREAMKDE